MKIAPQYQGPVVHVLDASRAVGVAARLLSDDLARRVYAAGSRANTRRSGNNARAERARGAAHARLARRGATGWSVDWTAVTPPRPTLLGIRQIAPYPLEDLVEWIDWTPFFQTWELRGHYPAILERSEQGSAARSLFMDAKALLETIVKERLLERARGVRLSPRGTQPETISKSPARTDREASRPSRPSGSR